MAEQQVSKEELEKRLQLMKENCIFCKISKKEIPSKVIFEDDICMAILDINPATNGHMLLFPKEHYMMMPMVPDEVLGHLSVISKYLTDLVKQTLGANDATVFMANGAAAGQQVQHFLMHVIPRYDDDKLNFNLQGSGVSKEELEQLSIKLKERLSTLNNNS